MTGIIAEAEIGKSIKPENAATGFWPQLKKTTAKVQRAVLEIFQNLIIATSFTFLIAGMAILSGHKIIAITTIACMTALMASFGEKFSVRVFKASSLVLEWIDNLQGPSFDDFFERSPSVEGKNYLKTINGYIEELKAIGAFFPQSIESLKDLEPVSLEAINDFSYLQYTFINGELAVRILARAKVNGKPALNEGQLFKTLKVLHAKYPNIRKIYLPQVRNISLLIPYLKNMQPKESASVGLMHLSLEDTSLNENQLRDLFSQVNLASLELRNCTLQDSILDNTDLLRIIKEKTCVYMYDEEGKSIGMYDEAGRFIEDGINEGRLQQAFESALNTKIMSQPAKKRQNLAKRFVNRLTQPTRSYFPLARLGVKLDLSLFENEELAKVFLFAFHQADYKVRELISFFTLDRKTLMQICGMPIKCLKTIGVNDLADLKFLPYLEELHLEFDGDIEQLLRQVPPHVRKIVLKRKFGSRLPSQPYLELIKNDQGQYKVNFYESSKEHLSADLAKLESDNIEIEALDFSGVGGLKDKKALIRIFTFSSSKQVVWLSLANCGLENKDLQGIDYKPNAGLLNLFEAKEDAETGYYGLKFLDLSFNPSLQHSEERPIFSGWQPRDRGIQIKIGDTYIYKG